MDAERWRQVKELYDAARAQTGVDRQAYLANACAGDQVLLDELLALLRQPTSTDSFLDALGEPGLALAVTLRIEPESSVRTGQRIGVYEVQRLLGAGGMGEVYRARDTKLGRDVAIKMLSPELIADSDRLMRFEREARLLASLNHPNIAAIHGLEEGDGPALVLELVEGETLKERLARGSLPLATAIQVARQLADALDAAHAKGIVHCDLKPANIKVTPDGAVKVLDFGIATVTTDGRRDRDAVGPVTVASGETRRGSIVGTAAYMSPEQARGELVDKRTDIWAFGCVLYEMLSGHGAFARETSAATLAAIAHDEPDWTTLPAAVPAAVRRLLRQSLKKDAAQRLGDIRLVRAELKQFAASPGKWRPVHRAAALIVIALSLVAGGAALFYSTQRATPARATSEYTQITNFTDSAVAPSLSPDGRMVTFIRGGDAFNSRGQIYVKMLPNGESVQLANDPRVKYGPVFTPDGSRVAYTVISNSATSLNWQTWSVPVVGGQPTLFLPNTSGLTWISDGRILFGEVKTGVHMGIVTATETRAGRREIYFPTNEHSMAHFAYLSPDRRWVLIVEMDQTHAFGQPCRLVPFDGSSAGRQVGPRGTCTSAAWSPDGRWMYFGVSVRGASHLWRQRFPDGAPEQVTFGPTEEEGVAIAPDGRSLVTSLGTRRSAIWIHDAAGERPLTSEGYARLPRFSRDGTRVFYLLQSNSHSSSAELRAVDLASGRSEPVLPGISVTDYDISRHETEVVFTTTDSNGESRISLAALNRLTPPREIVRGGDEVSFGADDDLFFRSLDTNALIRIRKDGSVRERITPEPIVHKFGVSPDGKWVIVFSLGVGHNAEAATLAIPVRGGSAMRIGPRGWPAAWSLDGRFIYLGRGTTTIAPAATVAIPVPAGKSLPDLPAAGIRSIAEGAELPGALSIEHEFMSPGPDPSTYVFTRTDLQRNLYRISLQ